MKPDLPAGIGARWELLAWAAVKKIILWWKSSSDSFSLECQDRLEQRSPGWSPFCCRAGAPLAADPEWESSPGKSCCAFWLWIQKFLHISQFIPKRASFSWRCVWIYAWAIKETLGNGDVGAAGSVWTKKGELDLSLAHKSKMWIRIGNFSLKQVKKEADFAMKHQYSSSVCFALHTLEQVCSVNKTFLGSDWGLNHWHFIKET